MTALALVTVILVAFVVIDGPVATIADTDSSSTGDDDPRSRPDHRSRGPPPAGQDA